MLNNARSTGNAAPELEIEGVVRERFFSAFDCTRRLGNIDFCVDLRDATSADRQSVVWAERKRGCDSLDDALVQLILTIGKARTFESELPPPFLAAFNAVEIAFIPYDKVMDVFSLNDFNWNVAPSDHTTREFADLRTRVSGILSAEKRTYGFRRDVRELKRFVANLARHPGAKIQITKTNFTHIYYKWREDVLPTIDMIDWNAAKKENVIDADFFLADILSTGNRTDGIYEKLRVLLEDDHYRQRAGMDNLSGELYREFRFRDRQKAHRQFWNKYRRPPRREYWSYIIERRDLLVPQDVRETKGAFFTPAKWVALSQEYLARELGDNWQEHYTVWDCSAGTGNMEVGLNTPRNVWASTLDAADVAVMKQRIGNGANLFENHVFQFDFLNDPFDKLPEELRAIVTDPERRKKLVIYINPPYAEVSKIGGGKKGVNKSSTHDKYATALGTAGRELYSQFLLRIDKELEGCIIGQFSTLKHLQGVAFEKYRETFRPELRSLFIVPANTFDNVNGEFPIGFFIWKTSIRQSFVKCVADVYDRHAQLIGKKLVCSNVGSQLMTDWVAKNIPLNPSGPTIGFLAKTNSNDFQNNNIICVLNKREQLPNPRGRWIDAGLLPICSVYFAVRKCIEATWLNDRDQFLYPNAGWKYDQAFQGDCLVYTLLHGQNRITSEQGVNHWIPYTEQEVGSRKGFRSHFMSDLLAGKVADGGVAEVRVQPRQGELAYATDGEATKAARLAYYNAQELGRTWYDVIAPEEILALQPVVVESVDPTANRRTVKEIFRKMAPVRNAADGRVVRFPVMSAKKLVVHQELNIFGLAASFEKIFIASKRAWSETAAAIPNHRIHANIDAYHQYVAKAVVGGETYYVRFTVREDASAGSRNELHGTAVSSIRVYKADVAGRPLRAHKHGEDPATSKATGTGLSLLSRTQGEDPAPFVDNKIALFLSAVNEERKIVLSAAARAVLDAGRELWKYYHTLPDAEPDASYYDIRKRFQGMKTTAKGKAQMSPTSTDTRYNELLAVLRDAQKALARQIEPKVYAYGFLKS